MVLTEEQMRCLAVERYRAGESPVVICHSLGRSRSWLFKWVERFDPDDPEWFKDHSRRPSAHPCQTPKDVEDLVVGIRQQFVDQGLYAGAQAILWEMQERGYAPLPSESTIKRIVRRRGLINKRTGRYQPKGTPYPEIKADRPNLVHQIDLVGPRYLHPPGQKTIRFYSLNSADLCTARCAVQPMLSKASQEVIEALWATWKRLGIPRTVQADNEVTFTGSPAHPRQSGCLIRLSLAQGAGVRFIPMGEPWRNGVVENFNRHYQDKLLGRVALNGWEDLCEHSLAFERKFNSRARPSKLGGKTPIQALGQAGVRLRFPPSEPAPAHPLLVPRKGRIQLVRLVRSDLLVDVFGEKFSVPERAQHQYVIATIDVKERKLRIMLDQHILNEVDYEIK